MKKLTRLFTFILTLIITLTSIPTANAEAATKIQLNRAALYFHTDLNTKTFKLTLNGAKASQVTWKASNGYRYNSKGKEVKTKVSKIVKVSKKGNVKAVGYGNATITATYKNKKYTCTVHVADYNKQPIAINTHKVSSMTKKSDKLFIKEVKDIINTYSNPNDRVRAAYLACIGFNNIYDAADFDVASEEHHDYDLSPFVTNWSFCDQTATVAGYLCQYMGIKSRNVHDYSMGHAWSAVEIDGVEYHFDADSGYGSFMSTKEELDDKYDSTPWLYNEEENGNGRAYHYGIIVKDGDHLHQLFQEMKENNVKTFKFRNWKYKNDYTAAKEIEQMLMQVTGIGSEMSGKLGTFENSNVTVTKEYMGALAWENTSFTITVHNWDAMNLQ